MRLLPGWFLLFSSLAQAGWQPEGSAVQAYEAARETLNSGDPVGAEQQFRALVASQPGCGLCAQGLGYSLLLQNRRSEAKSVLVEAAGRFPRQPEMQTSLSEAAFAAQDFALARSAATTAVGLAPASIDAALALQAVLLRTGDYGAADDALDDATGLPAGERACLRVGLAMEQDDLRVATEQLATCKAAEREDLVTMIEGLYAQATGARTEATSLMDALGVESVRLIADAIDRYNGGDPQGAITVLDQVIAKNPERLDAWLMRGQARWRVGDKAAARQDLERAFKGGTWVEVHSTGMMSGILRKSDEEKLRQMVMGGSAILARLYVESGETGKARAVLERAKSEGRLNNDLLAAEVELLTAEGRKAEAWKLLAAEIGKGNKGNTLLDAAGNLAWKDLPGAPPAVLAAIREGGPGTARYNLASAWLNAKKPKDCLSEVTATPGATHDAMLAADRLAMDRLGYRCAVYADDLPAADQRLAALGALSGVEYAAVYNHAMMRANAKRPADVLTLLDSVPAPDARSHANALSLQIAANVALQQWSRAAALGQDKDCAPQDLSWLAFQLSEAGLPVEARGLLVRACPKLSGKEAEQCRALLAELGG